MLSTLLLVLPLMLLLVVGMAVGVLFGREPMKGSCGGLAARTGERCEFCGDDPTLCDARPDSGLARDVGRSSA